MPPSTPPGSPGPPSSGGPAPGHRPIQPVRAVLVLVVAVVIGVAVLARMNASPSIVASVVTTSTTLRVSATTTSASTTTTTTAPTTTTTTRAPSSVTVLVLNGWTTAHAALYFQKTLAADGYDTLAPNNATDETTKASQIFVLVPSDNGNALAIASALTLSPSVVVAPTAANDAAVPVADLHQKIGIILVVGADISGRVPTGYKG
jgi:hypothetical protein